MTDIEERKRPAEGLSNDEPKLKQQNTTTTTLSSTESTTVTQKPQVKGVAAIKPEFIISSKFQTLYNDDDAESAKQKEQHEQQKGKNNDKGKGKGKGKKKNHKGQNKNRDLRQEGEEIRLCISLIDPNDDSRICKFGADSCRFTHNIEEYLSNKPQDISGMCPVFQELGYCPTGLKCRWLSSHYNKETKNLIYDESKFKNGIKIPHNGEVNWIDAKQKNELQKRQIALPLSDLVIPYVDSLIQSNNPKKEEPEQEPEQSEEQEKDESLSKQETIKQNSTTYIEAPFKPEEKKPLNLKNAKIVSPLTTVGNLPYRRLMKTLGADITYSEMAFALPLIQGSNSEWALPKAHESEYPGFGVQIATSKNFQACKAAEAISKLTTHVSELNLNCGCPIDLLYRQGQGSALLEQPNRMVRLLKGMNYCSGDIPVTVKIRMGSRDNNPVADVIVQKLLKEGDVAAITLHGRSRQQRYTREADWDYVSKIGSIVQEYNADQVEDKDARDKRPVYLVGNGDCFTHEDWYKAVKDPNIDSVMIARGALIKPWIFEEIEAKQYIDKSATERLSILEKYSKFAITHWGSDEYGVNSARRFLCEFMSFTHRYIPVGILERLPPKLNERPPQWKGRNELETLLGSNDANDWIKISEMFLGKSSDSFKFIPKHKSNSYETSENLTNPVANQE
ncbi:hypothetical protein B5S28_g4043 [[Candida] boidinii]|nr:hypothetical protein B5S28_g4043 [[Candida] boidinii]